MTSIKRKVKSKRKTRYDKVKYPGLQLNKQSRLNREYVDYDYLDQLSPEEKAFMSKFTQEHYSGTFQKDEELDAKNEKRITKGLEEIDVYTYGDYDPATGKGNLIESSAERKKLYTKNNKKLQDIHGQVKAFSKFKDYDNLILEGTNDDQINDLLDAAAKNPDKVKKFKNETSNTPGTEQTNFRPPKKHQE